MSHQGSLSRCFQLTIVRHGETEYNKNGIIQGQSDVLLSAAGLEQAEAVAKRLAPERFDLIFSSDLSRAYKTADVIVSRSEWPREIVSDSLLRERHLGDAQGRSVSDLVAAARRTGRSLLDYTPPGGESHGELTVRARGFFDKLVRQCYSLSLPSSSSFLSSAPKPGELLARYGNGLAATAPSLHVLVVSHGGWIRNLMEHLKRDYQNVSLPKNAVSISPNTGVTSLLVTCENTSTPCGSSPSSPSPSLSQQIVCCCTAVTSLCMHDASHL